MFFMRGQIYFVRIILASVSLSFPFSLVWAPWLRHCGGVGSHTYLSWFYLGPCQCVIIVGFGFPCFCSIVRKDAGWFCQICIINLAKLLLRNHDLNPLCHAPFLRGRSLARFAVSAER